MPPGRGFFDWQSLQVEFSASESATASFQRICPCQATGRCSHVAHRSRLAALRIARRLAVVIWPPSAGLNRDGVWRPSKTLIGENRPRAAGSYPKHCVYVYLTTNTTSLHQNMTVCSVGNVFCSKLLRLAVSRGPFGLTFVVTACSHDPPKKMPF